MIDRIIRITQIVLTILLFTAPIVNTAGQSHYSLSDCIEIAIEGSAQVKQAQASVAIAAEAKKGAACILLFHRCLFPISIIFRPAACSAFARKWGFSLSSSPSRWDSIPISAKMVSNYPADNYVEEYGGVFQNCD